MQTAVHELYDPAGAPAQPTVGGATSASVPQLPAAKVSVTVLNGSGRRGLAASVSRQLRKAGYLATDGGNASSFSFTTTSVAGDASSLAARHGPA